MTIYKGKCMKIWLDDIRPAPEGYVWCKSVNIAKRTIESAEEPILLIDCDLRKNTLHKYMGLSNKHGLTDALLEYRQTKKLNVEYFQSVNDPSFAGTMAVLTSGFHIPNPSELLGSHVFKDYINELKKSFDFIIIDCAPIGMISDAIPVGNAVDGTIFAISSQDTNKKDAANIQHLEIICL